MSFMRDLALILNLEKGIQSNEMSLLQQKGRDEMKASEQKVRGCG